VLDQSEFETMYGCVPSLLSSQAPAAFAAAGAKQVSGVVGLDTDGFTRFLSAAFKDQPPIVFNAAMMEMMQRASSEAGRRADSHVLGRKSGEWAARILKVVDMDGNGLLEHGEFLMLYDCIPGLDPAAANSSFAAAVQAHPHPYMQ